MTESLVNDRDLRFDHRDHQRVAATSLGESPNVILHQSSGGLYYSKPPIYPFLVAPFFWFFGRSAFWIVNTLLLCAASSIAWKALGASTLDPEESESSRWRSWKLATYLGTAAVLPYLAWSMSDILQFSLALAGVSSAIVAMRATGSTKRQARAFGNAERWAMLAGVCIGLMVISRAPQALLALSVIGMAAVARRTRIAMVIAGSLLTMIVFAATLQFASVGTLNPYTAARTSFSALIGYPTDAEDPLVGEQLAKKRATHVYQTSLDRRIPWSAFYGVVGRHAGLLPYFPFALFMIYWGLRGRNAATVALLGVLALWVFYLLYRPDNYFGGSATVGNRYFLPSYGLLFAVLAWPQGGFASARRWSLRVAVVSCWLIAVAAGVSAWASVREVGALDPTSQSHASAGIFRWLPYESTARETEGQRSRFWGRDYVRFVDFRSKVGAEDWVLGQTLRPSEIMVVTHRKGDGFRFQALASPGTKVTIRPWWGRSEVVASEFLEGQPVEMIVPPSTPWIRHPMAFDLETKHFVHRFLIQVEAPQPESAVRLRYLGVVNPEKRDQR